MRSTPINNMKRVIASQALDFAPGADEFFRMTVELAWKELWESHLRGDIKPGHTYDICVQFRDNGPSKKVTDEKS